jgi:hypothetical protein
MEVSHRARFNCLILQPRIVMVTHRSLVDVIPLLISGNSVLNCLYFPSKTVTFWTPDPRILIRGILRGAGRPVCQ